MENTVHGQKGQESKKQPARSALPMGSAGGRKAGGQTHISCPPQTVNFGVDTLEITFQAEVPEYITQALREQKASIQASNKDQAHFNFGVSNLFSWNLQRQGTKLFPYILRTGDVILGISTRNAASNIPSMMLKVGSISCQDDLEGLLKTFRLWCRKFNIQIGIEKVSRIDLAADLAIPIEQLQLHDRERMITRAVTFDLHYQHCDLTGATYGKGSTILLRIYDKIAEMAHHQDQNKESFFRKKWGDVKDVTRVEFQLKREVIKQIFSRKSDFQTIWKFRERIWKYLTEEWFRQTETEVDRENGNQKKSKISAFWQSVQAAWGFTKKAVVRKRAQLHINIPALLKQGVGVLTSICAGLGHMGEDFFEMVGTVTDLVTTELAKAMAEPDFTEKFRIKQSAAIVSF